MTVHQLNDYAHQFFRKRGDYAEYDAAQNARMATDPKEAANWRCIHELVRQLRVIHLN